MALYGWCGRIAQIDLSRASWRAQVLDPQILKHWVGGRGLAGLFLRDHITLAWDHPEMPLLFFTGPLVNTPSPTSGRMTIMSRSPLTGTVGSASVGGSLGTALKKAGWDGLIITGRSNALCGLSIEDDQVRIVPAAQFAGQTTSQVAAALPPKSARVIIGPAAENGVRFASIMVDRHYAAGRNGLGLVMAAKNLKYITVRGHAKTKVYDSDQLKAARRVILRQAAASPALMGPFGLTHFGTGALYDLIHARHMMPTKNFCSAQFADAPHLNAHYYQQRYKPHSGGCRGCHIRCKRQVKDGQHLPEFETMAHFSALLENSDGALVVEANRLCNDFGMDTISCAATLACYAELQGRRLAPHDIVDLLHQIASGRGLGKRLGQGAARFAAQAGYPETAIAVKSQELPAYDPRGAYGMALGYAVASRGACHLQAYPIGHEILRKPVATHRLTFEGKARMIKIGEDVNAVVDSLTACKFIFFATSLEEYAHVFHAVTGVPVNAQELLRIGERICYHERIMNHALGFRAKDDDLPRRFFTNAGAPSHTAQPVALDRETFLEARGRYYRVRGLDQHGRPTAEMAKRLNLPMMAP